MSPNLLGVGVPPDRGGRSSAAGLGTEERLRSMHSYGRSAFSETKSFPLRLVLHPHEIPLDFRGANKILFQSIYDTYRFQPNNRLGTGWEHTEHRKPRDPPSDLM